MSKPGGARINPLSRRPRQQRLVVAVRGAAGTGKSHFAASMADAGLGRLCYFDVERKARLLPGSDGSKFDALEIRHPDELPEFIDWALDGEGREQGYGCYVLDSWAMYFGRKHRDTLLAAKDNFHQRLSAVLPDEVSGNDLLLHLCKKLTNADPDKRFASAQAADLERRGAAAFHRQLVKGDLASEYENDLRSWLEELE